MLFVPRAAEPLDFCSLCSIHPSNFPACRRAFSRRDPLPAASHRHRHVAGRGATGQGTLDRFSSRALSPGLVLLALGQGAGGDGAGVDSRGPASGLSRGRHQSAAQGQTRLRQGVSSRRLPLDAQSRGLGVGSQVGDVGDQREVPLRLAAVGVAGVVRLVPAGGVEPPRRPAAQEAHSIWPCS